MFDTLKRLIGISKPVEDVIAEEAEAREKIKKAEKVTTIYVTNGKTKSFSKGEETPLSLGKMTKKNIDDLAKENFGIELDRRLTKDKMIVEYMTAQQKAK